MSQVEVAERAGLSREGYRRIEEGVVVPRTDSVARIAAVLRVQPDELFRPVGRLTAVRFRALKRMTSREDLLTDVARWLDDYTALEDLLGASKSFALRPLTKGAAGGPVDPIRLAADARTTLHLDADEAIRDVCGLLENAGVKLYTPQIASDGFFGLSVGDVHGGPAVVVNCWDRISVERWIFTSVHEVGHLLMHLSSFDVGQHVEDPVQEREANLFASHFLMPDELFTSAWDQTRGLAFVDRVMKIKRIFHVSWKTVVYRISERATDSRRVWMRFHAEYKSKTGKSLRVSDEPESLPCTAFHSAPAPRVADEPERLVASDFLENRLHDLVRQAVEAEAIPIQRAAEILRVDTKTMRRIAKSWMDDGGTATP